MLIFHAKKHGTGWVGGWSDGRAWFRIAYSNKKIKKNECEDSYFTKCASSSDNVPTICLVEEEERF